VRCEWIVHRREVRSPEPWSVCEPQAICRASWMCRVSSGRVSRAEWVGADGQMIADWVPPPVSMTSARKRLGGMAG